MAVVTFTRRHVVDMLPEYLTKRSSGFGPTREAIAREAGVEAPLLTLLISALLLAEDSVVRRDRYIWRSPYAIKRDIDEGWAKAVEVGWAEATTGGWRVKPHAMALAEKIQRGLRDSLRALPLPADAVKRAADALEPIADRIPAGSKRAELVHKQRPKADEPKTDILRLNRAVAELWYFRDDCHVGAWQDAGYEGPVFDVLSFIWPGRPDMAFTKMAAATSLDALAEALKARQDWPDVERAVATLVERGDVIRDGASVRLSPKGQVGRDGVEDETDRRFFTIWQLDDAASARLGEDLRAVIDAFPKPG